MRTVVLAAVLSVFVPHTAAAQTAPASSPNVAEAYAQFLLGHHLEEDDDFDGAIAAYQRAMTLDPTAADITAQLAGLYLRQNKVQEAMATAEQALKVAPDNSEANRVLGIVHAALAEASSGRNAKNDENLAKAIQYLERALEHPQGGIADPNLRATLARAYLNKGVYDKAIPLLSDLVKQEPGWSDGPMLLAEAYAGAGRTKDAIAWLEDQNDPRLAPALGDFYEREQRWSDAAKAYERALQRSPRNAELKTRYASVLLKTGNRQDTEKARDVLTEVVTVRPDVQSLYLLSQAQRRMGDSRAAEASARRAIAQNSRNPWGHYALAEALEERREYQAVVNELAPIVADLRSKPTENAFASTLLLPHLGFAYQELGQHDKAIASFEEARKLSPKDPAVSGYLIEANMAAKKYAAAADLARAAVADNPDDLRLLRLQAQALRHTGKADQSIAVLEDAVKKHADDPIAYVALAQLYSDLDRGPQAVKVLQDAQAKFPSDTSIVFELGATYDKQKRFADAEAAFKQLIAREPDNSAALNYLGYMLAERGERLDESVNLLQKALQIDPDNGSYLDSLGWAYFKLDKLDLAEDNLRRAADQLKMNSVIQDHHGDVLYKMGRLDEAIAAWTRALNGDGDSVNRGDIDKKIKTARQKMPRR
jgi:tetratricopeptide (TPR) repeat protein